MLSLSLPRAFLVLYGASELLCRASIDLISVWDPLVGCIVKISNSENEIGLDFDLLKNG